MTMYKIPDLIFIKDESIEYGNKIDKILSTITYVTKPDDDTGEEADNEDDNA